MAWAPIGACQTWAARGHAGEGRTLGRWDSKLVPSLTRTLPPRDTMAPGGSPLCGCSSFKAEMPGYPQALQVPGLRLRCRVGLWLGQGDSTRLGLSLPGMASEPSSALPSRLCQ